MLRNWLKSLKKIPGLSKMKSGGMLWMLRLFIFIFLFKNIKKNKKAANIKASELLMNEKELPLQYYSAYSIVGKIL